MQVDEDAAHQQTLQQEAQEEVHHDIACGDMYECELWLSQTEQLQHFYEAHAKLCTSMMALHLEA